MEPDTLTDGDITHSFEMTLQLCPHPVFCLQHRSLSFCATVTFHFSTQPSFHVFKTAQLAQIKLHFDRKNIFPSSTFCFLSILRLFSPVWHMAASSLLTADVTSPRLISTLYPPISLTPQHLCLPRIPSFSLPLHIQPF